MTNLILQYFMVMVMWVVKFPRGKYKIRWTHCSTIARYPSFFSQDFFFHFSSYIHNGDNLNFEFSLRIFEKFKKILAIEIFSLIFLDLTCKIVAILRNRHKSLKNLQTVLKLV